MRVFVTGSTGYVGSAVVQAFVAAGHVVGGLVRDASKEAALRALGGVPILGHLKDPETYQHFAAESDAVIHCAFESAGVDQAATEALLGAMIAEGSEGGQPRSFIYTSGVWVLGTTAAPADEGASTETPAPISTWRPPIERHVLENGNEQVATAVLRPGIVWGGKRGILKGWVDGAATGSVTYIGDGRNHFPPVHRDDLARLYLLIAEKRARGVFHGVDGSAPTIREAAEAIAKAAGAKDAHGWPVAEARSVVGPFADAMCLDQKVIAKRAAELGWKPAKAPFLAHAAEAVREAR
jgi:nucleoside-diphosphate-sugar epimerase